MAPRNSRSVNRCGHAHLACQFPINVTVPFQIVADFPGITERALAVWLRNPHPNMPDFILPQADMENVIAYIMSLKSTAR